MPNYTGKVIAFGKLGRRVFRVDFNGGELGTDAGLLLLRKADERIGLGGWNTVERAPAC